MFSQQYCRFLIAKDSTVGTVTGNGLNDRVLEFDSQWGKKFLLLHSIQTSSGAYPATYPMGIGGSFRESKAAGA
jgi:hypothetical protein